MQMIRRRLPWLVAGWMAVQVAAVAATPVALGARALTDEAASCTCPDGMARQQCPMNRDHGSDQSDPNRCAMRSTLGQSDVFLVLVTPGIVPQRGFVPHVPEPVALLPTRHSLEPSRSELPESPPPRT